MTPNPVKPALTTNRRRPVVENDEYAAFARRIIGGLGRRVGAGDVEAITQLVALSTDLDSVIREAIRGLRGFGYSWAEIGTRLGVSKQAVQQRWGGEPR